MLFTLKQHDVSTSGGRAAERLRRITLTALASGGARVIGLLAPLVTIPVTLCYLGEELFGLWMTITTFVALFAFADLGLGNGMLTAVSRASGREDHVELGRTISSGFFLLLSLSCTLLFVLLPLFRLLPWDSILGIRINAYHDAARAAVLVSFIIFLFNLPVSLVQRVQFGLQQGFESSLWQTLGSVAGMFALLLAVKFQATLPWLVLCAAGVPSAALALNFVWFFAGRARHLLPRARNLNWDTSQRLLGQGIQYFVLTLLLSICFGVDNLIIAHVLGHTAVTEYSIPFRLVSIIGFLPSMVLMPLWTANGEAMARGEVAWVRANLTNVTRVLFVAMSIGGGLFLLAGPLVLTKWFGMTQTPDAVLMSGLFCGTLAIAMAGPHFMVLNGAGEVPIQLAIYGALTPVYLVTKIVLAKHLGVAGPAIAGAVVGLLGLYPLARAASLRVIRNQVSKGAHAC